MMEQIMVVAPHPDDETLGCGGTILKLKELNKKLYWVVVTNMSVQQGFSVERVIARQKELEDVAEFYAFDEVYKLDFPATKLDTFPLKEIIDSLSAIISKVRPDTIFMPYRSDIHSDHRVTFDVVLSCVKIFRAPFVKRLFMYEVISETEFSHLITHSIFTPHSFCDITNYIEKKIEAMNIYKGEMGIHPFSRSVEAIRALAILRGAMAGYKYAEAFQVLKEIIVSTNK